MSTIARCGCYRPHTPATNTKPTSSSGWDKLQNDAKKAGASLDSMLDEAMELTLKKGATQADQQQAQIIMAKYSARSQGLSNIFKTLSDSLQAVVRNFR